MEQIGADGRSTVIIHYTYEVDGGWRIACMPNMTEFHATPYHPHYPRSNRAGAVSCPACQNTAVFKRAPDHAQARKARR